MEWVFDEKARGEKARDPLNEEFFSDTQLLTDVDSLVRESIQNSLDAKRDNASHVHVRLRLGTLGASSAKPWFESALSHLESGLPGFERSLLDGPCRYLIVEDFGTTGLCGDPTLEDTQIAGLPSSETSYHYFVHIEGNSNKDDGKRGKWGVGKVVFQKVSAIKTLLLMSVRAEQWPVPRLALGQSVLNYHSVDNRIYRPDGWLAERSDSGMFLPLPDSGYWEMSRVWGVNRGADDFGLSIVSPYISDDVSAEALIGAVVKQYFVPIIAGDLRVEVSTESETVLIDRGTIEHLAEVTDGAHVETVQMLVALSNGELARFRAIIPEGATAASQLEIPESVINEARRELDNFKPVVFDVEMYVPVPHSSAKEKSKCTLVLATHDSSSRVLFSREGVIVPQSRAVMISRLHCLALVEEGALANLLARAEGPAHENWSDGTKKFVQSYGKSIAATRAITWVRKLPVELANRLHGAQGQLDFSALTNYFPRPTSPSSAARSPGVSGPGRGTPSVVPPTPPDGNSASFSVDQLGADGVRVSQTFGEVPISPIEIKFAYKVAKGNSFAKYSPDDFDLRAAGFQCSTQGAQIVGVVENGVRLQILEETVILEVRGFDTRYRDVEVTVLGVES